MQTLAIDLWTWRLDCDSAELARLAGLLSADECARADRFKFEIHANRYKAGRGRLRQILGRYLNAAPEAVKIAYGENQKPELARQTGAEGWRFNLSHTGDLAALAVCRGVDVGLDIEFVKPIEDAVAKFHFSPLEYATLSKLHGAAWLNGFYRCWTRKEAMVKALGDGLFLPLDSFDVTFGDGEAPEVLRLEGDGDAKGSWRLHHFEPAPTCMGAIAVRSGGAPVQVEWRDLNHQANSDPFN